MNQRFRIFTWPAQQQYLFELAQGEFDFYVPSGQDGSFKALFAGQKNVTELDPQEIKNTVFDCILFQDEQSYESAQYEILSAAQRNLPKIYLEHHPPKQHPTNAKHIVEDENVQLIHVNHYNALMWDNNQLPFKVIENGVSTDTVRFLGTQASGIVVFEKQPADDRVTGYDLFLQVKEALPLDVVQIGKENVTFQNLPEKISPYRFLFCPDRYASPGFAVYQAMMMGMPVVGLATTALPTILENEVSGFTDSDLHYLIGKMQDLINDYQLAVQTGAAARRYASEKFTSDRFLSDWKRVFEHAFLQTC